MQMDGHVGSHGPTTSPDVSQLIPDAFQSLPINTAENQYFIRFYRIGLPCQSLIAAKSWDHTTPLKIYQLNSAFPSSSVSRRIKIAGCINNTTAASLRHLPASFWHRLFGVTLGSRDHETWLKWWSFCWTLYVCLRTLICLIKTHIPPLYF